jgi:endo-1,4-beta-D-glucanase Y
VQGPDGWSGRPKNVKTIRVSTLPPELHKLFKKLIGARRWTTPQEVQRLLDLKKFKFTPDNQKEV